jgi:pilus biogenesis lipoprotein CpaD
MTAAPQLPYVPHPRRSRPLLWASILGLGLGLGACAPANLGPNPNLGWLEAGSPKQIEVDRADYRHAVYFETDRAEISAVQQDRLRAFLASVQPGNRDTIRLEGHADERASDVYNIELAARRAAAVRTLLDEQGLAEVSVTSSAFGEALPADPGIGPEAWRENRRVEVVVERYLITLPPCPDWSKQSGTDFANQPHSNFGCATQTNLGLMVAEPRDLVRGRSLAPADGVHAAEAIVRYRTGKVVELKEERVEN